MSDNVTTIRAARSSAQILIADTDMSYDKSRDAKAIVKWLQSTVSEETFSELWKLLLEKPPVSFKEHSGGRSLHAVLELRTRIETLETSDRANAILLRDLAAEMIGWNERP